jgi:hypothetical protein
VPDIGEPLRESSFPARSIEGWAVLEIEQLDPA